MTPPRRPSLTVLLLALLALPACSKPKDSAGPAGSSAASSAAHDTIAPVILPPGTSHPAITAVDDPHYAAAAAPRVTLDETFLFEMGMGDGRDGLNVTTVSASGQASHVYGGRENGDLRWQRVTFEVGKPDMERLARLLEEKHFFKMAQVYQAPGVHDGAHWIFHLRTGGLDKFVSADNAFPDDLTAVARFVTEQLIDTRPGLRAQSKPAPLGPDYGAHLWRGARIYAGSLEGEVPSFQDAARIAALLVPSTPLPEDTQIEASIVDRSDSDEELTRTAPSGPRCWVFYNGAKVRPNHHYALRVKLLAGTRVLATSEDLPVITFDGANALEVPLARP
jgi:hypothetical protein